VQQRLEKTALEVAHQATLEEPIELVREPTDPDLANEDVQVTGGTNDNQVMNGVYFRITATFGIPVYRNVRTLTTRFSTVVAERFIYKRDRDLCWVITEHVGSDISQKSGHAFVHEDTESPGHITESWFVWHAQTNSFRYWGEDEAEDQLRSQGKASNDQEGFFSGPSAPIDHIKCKCLAGFEVQGRGVGGVSPGLLIRNATELYGRPVYKGERGDQLLYFMAKDVSAEHGLEKTGMAMTAEDLVTNPNYDGHWVISTEFGINIDSPSCLAYVEDRAVTPHTITKQWFVVALNQKTSELKLVVHESCAGPDALAPCDRLEEDNDVVMSGGTPMLPLEDRKGRHNPAEAFRDKPGQSMVV